MGCTVVVGGQYGSEGKGKVVRLLCQSKTDPWVVRCGGPNSGHTTSVEGKEMVLRQVPAGVSNPRSTLLLAAGCAIDEEILLHEVNALSLPRSRVVLDPRAVLITSADRHAEGGSVDQIGSTGSGTGAALVRRINRAGDASLAVSSLRLKERIRVEPVAPLLHDYLDRGGEVVVEGTQGFGLSLLHGLHYPYLTARDTTAAGFAMEVGISPRQVDAVVLVIRTFPIRVGGNSGPLAEEISWEEVRDLGGAPEAYQEHTSVTKRLRRVARFDLKEVERACRYNRPTSLAIMGIDRLDHANRSALRREQLTDRAWQFLRQVANQTNVPVSWVGTGFLSHEAVALE